MKTSFNPPSEFGESVVPNAIKKSANGSALVLYSQGPTSRLRTCKRAVCMGTISGNPLNWPQKNVLSGLNSLGQLLGINQAYCLPPTLPSVRSDRALLLNLA
jgi:hypothetical protein